LYKLISAYLFIAANEVSKLTMLCFTGCTGGAPVSHDEAETSREIQQPSEKQTLVPGVLVGRNHICHLQEPA